MKNIFLLFVGLVANSASFAAANEPIKPLATAYLIGNEKVKLVVAPQEVWATLAFQDEQGHVLYSSNVNLRDGLKQNFDVSGLEKGVYKTVHQGWERNDPPILYGNGSTQSSINNPSGRMNTGRAFG